jgi:hypothetical protein
MVYVMYRQDMTISSPILYKIFGKKSIDLKIFLEITLERKHEK